MNETRPNYELKRVMDDGSATVAEVYSVEDGRLQLGVDRRGAMGTVLTIAAALVGISGSADAATKKSCKKGYKWDSKKKKCVKKKSSSSSSKDKDSKKKSSSGGGSICSCNKVCTCVPVYY